MTYLNQNDQQPDLASIRERVDVVLTGSADALNAHAAISMYFVNTGGVDAMTLAAPTAITDDGKIFRVCSLTAQAHTITCPAGVMNGGAVGNTVATFAAHPGASIELIAWGGKWYILAAQGITLT